VKENQQPVVADPLLYRLLDSTVPGFLINSYRVGQLFFGKCGQTLSDRSSNDYVFLFSPRVSNLQERNQATKATPQRLRQENVAT
jgi:hypothetical protein